MLTISDKEIRQKLLESNDPKGWNYSIGEQMRDNLTDDQAAMLAYHYYRGDITALVEYFREIIGPIIEKAMAREIEQYKEKNDIIYGRDDCSAYKESLKQE